MDVTVSLERIADIKRQTGDSMGALAAYEEGLAIRRHLAEQDRADGERQRSVAVALGKICDVKRQIGDVQGATAACVEVLDIAPRNG